MKRSLAILPIAAAALAFSLAPASAQYGGWQGQQYQGGWNNGGWQNNGWDGGWNNRGWNNGYNNGWQRQGWNQGWNGGWNSRNVSGGFRFSDPSYNSDVRFRANPYRCTEDLGYGRYEFCGW